MQPCWRKRHHRTSRFPCVIGSQVPLICCFWYRLRDERRTRRTHSCSRPQSPCTHRTLCKLATSQSTNSEPRRPVLSGDTDSPINVTQQLEPCFVGIRLTSMRLHAGRVRVRQRMTLARSRMERPCCSRMVRKPGGPSTQSLCRCRHDNGPGNPVRRVDGECKGAPS